MSLFLVVAPLGFTFSTEGRAQGYEDTGKRSPSDHTANPSFLLLSLYFTNIILICHREQMRLEKATYDLEGQRWIQNFLRAEGSNDGYSRIYRGSHKSSPWCHL